MLIRSVDRIGYGTRVRPEGNLGTCFGSEADVDHQMVQALRNGAYRLQGHEPASFPKVCCARSPLASPLTWPTWPGSTCRCSRCSARTTRCSRRPAGQQQAARYVGSPDVTLAMIPDASHYPLVEATHLEVVSAVDEWLDRHS